jgi:hypothetical protein
MPPPPPPHGSASIGVYEISTGRWLLRDSLSAGAPDHDFSYGGPGLMPVAGDWDGTGHAGIGVYEIGTGRWLLRGSNSAGAPDHDFSYGGPGLMPVAGDWKGPSRPAAARGWHQPATPDLENALGASLLANRRRSETVDAVFAAGL